MLWIILMILADARSQTVLDEVPRQRILFNDLTNSYDHCRDPQTLNRETWTCECPHPLIKRGDECVCEDCLFNTNQESYVVKDNSELPEYLAAFLKDIDQELEEEKKISDSSGIVSQRMLWNTKNNRQRKGPIGKVQRPKKLFKSERRMQRYLRRITAILNSLRTNCEEPLQVPGRRSGVMRNPRIILADRENSMNNVLKGLRFTLRKKSGRIPLRKIDWSKSRLYNLKEGRKAKQEKEGMTYSDSTIGDQSKGRVKSGADVAYGALANLFGTGSISLGAGQGSAAASAYTGEGLSLTGVESLGAKAFGLGLIGKKAFRGTSTTTLLIGEGDAIATNSQSKKSSASATAIATKKTASAGSTALGAATAAASATPGKGDTNASATYGKDLNVIAVVSGKTGAVAETVAVGNAVDDLQDFIQKQRQNHTTSALQQSFFRGVPTKVATDFDVLGLDNDVDDAGHWLGLF